MNITHEDEIIMRLVHYFITKENYSPIIVNGLDNEIWLENSEKKYNIIRINSNYIHNNEQYSYDLFKIKNVIKQIKKKTFSFKCNTLNILLNVGENVNLDENTNKLIDVFNITGVEDFETTTTFGSLYPMIVEDKIEGTDSVDFFMKVTNDINHKTEERNKLFEKTFNKKFIFVTYLLIIINIIAFALQQAKVIDTNRFVTSGFLLKYGDWYRILTSGFLHADILHLVCNMYALYVLGTQLENLLGKFKFTIIYFGSLIFGSIMSGAIGVVMGRNVASLGASGAIFGLMGALLYFGYHYRMVLGNFIKSQIVPIIALNLMLGFMTPGIDNAAHIGGLIGGYFVSMIVGIEGKTSKSDTINGIIVSVAMIGFLIFIIMR